MSCTPVQPCGDAKPRLVVVPPVAGAPYFTRRLGGFGDFLADLIATAEQTKLGRTGSQGVLGDRWDVAGDPHGELLAELWAIVADGVARYTELTANESYVGTASDWADLRRLAALLGYKPRPPVAATGWIVAEIDRGASPLVPAGTKVQAPAAPAALPPRPKTETFEVVADTPLRADWGSFTATWVPQPAIPQAREVRFLGDPGFSTGDRVFFVLEQAPGPSGLDWIHYWTWMIELYYSPATPQATPLALTKVNGRASDLGTTLVEFDRDLSPLLDDLNKSYAAYRVSATAGSARRLSKVLKFGATDPSPAALSSTVPATISFYDTDNAITGTSVILDTALDDVSKGQLVAVVDWNAGNCDVVTVASNVPVHWENAPGSPTRVSKLTFASSVGTLANADGSVTVHVLDRRQIARHYDFPPDAPSAAPASIRLYPAPAVVPELLALDTVTPPDGPVWQVLSVSPSVLEEHATDSLGNPVPAGLIVDASGPISLSGRTRATANLVPVHHGVTTRATLGSGDALNARLALEVPDAPVASDLDASGNVVPSLVVRVDGVAWPDAPTLYATGPAQEFVAQLQPDGGVVVAFGDGEQGQRPPTGRNNITAVYRVGGGTAGEVPGGAINALAGSVHGVKKVLGAGPTSGGADQDDERRLRTLVPARARAFGRIVAGVDLVDLALDHPGVTHAAQWHGAGPPGCPCGGVGLHVATLRSSAEGTPRAPFPEELVSLAAFLDSRRDTLVPLCVCAGTATALAMSATLVVDPRRAGYDVVSTAVSAVGDSFGPLAPLQRKLGQALDQSDVFAVLHAVTGVVGVTGLVVAGATITPSAAEADLGRQPAHRWELLVVPATPSFAWVNA